MTKVSIELPDEIASGLARMAERLGTSVESLATAGIADILTRVEDQFSQVIDRVLDKNAELYKRLS